MHLRETPIPGCYEIVHDCFADARGSFVKTFHQKAFLDLGLRTDWQEEYYSVSAKGVLRGMHFQSPPHAHAKLVSCLQGQAHAVVLDLRRSSPGFGRTHILQMSHDSPVALYIPAGVAHGFLSLTENCLMHYKVTSVHVPAADAGVRWDSFGHIWPINNPILSLRDTQHPNFDDFSSPFP